MTSPDVHALIKALNLSVGSADPSMDVDLFNSAAKKIASKTNRGPYTGDYLRNIVRGKQPMTKAVASHCQQYIRAKAKEPSIAATENSIVKVAEGVNFVPGSVVLMDSVLCPCGVWFTPKVPNQLYHTPPCKKLKGK